MSKSIRFKAQGSSSVLGNFGPGDIARNIDDALADHLVKEALCAEYLVTAAQPAVTTQKTNQPVKGKRKAT